MTAVCDTASRLRRLLAILTWLAQVGEVPIDEVATRFGLLPDALVAELELAACCGVPPFTPDQLLEIIVTDETVSTRVGTVLARPRRLSPREGLALAAAARAVLAVPGSDVDGSLARALSTLERALGEPSVAVELDRPEHLDIVREALESGGRLAVNYYSASTDQTADRAITPRQLFASEGHWYVDAWCDAASGVRRFRVDRILSVRPDDSGESGPPSDGPSGDQSVSSADTDPPAAHAAFVPGPDSRQVRLVADPAMSWLLESVPSAALVSSDGSSPVWDVYVGGDAWLERLLLRLGPASVVLKPESDRALAPAAAARILARYGDSAD